MRCTTSISADDLASAARRAISVDFGIVNALDQAPARQAEFSIKGAQSSLYADPRRSRVELTVSAGF